MSNPNANPGKQMTEVEALLSGDRRALARAITVLESTRAADRRLAEKLLRCAMPHTGNSIRIAISGAPGVGKSTFIEAFGNRATEQGHRIAVLTVDPTSSFSGGSILGDKTRMHTLATNPHAFIRSSPSGQILGGVARRTGEAMLVCEAAGFDLIVVETVGVGQSEILAASMTDIFLLLLLPTAGDELQGIKRGIMELADVVVVNKADGDMKKSATAAAADIQHALALLKPPPKPNPKRAQWRTPVVLVSSIEKTGLDEVQQKINECRRWLETDGALQKRRRRQAKQWLWNETREQLLAELKQDNAVREALAAVVQQVSDGKLPASVAARDLIATFMRSAP